MTDRSIVLIDGEHYPPVIARAVARMREEGENLVGALMVGGTEKAGRVPLDIGIPVNFSKGGIEESLASAIEEFQASRVIDLSDEPVLGFEERMRLASVALFKGAAYTGAGFAFRVPPRPKVASVPSLAVIGTGKRVGKTGIASAAARVLKEIGLRPVIVAMGRGGPDEPRVIEDPAEVSPEMLLAISSAGEHAASDYLEDAMAASVPTVGAWRAGGGMTGDVVWTNFPRAVEAARRLDPGLLILEGSGAAIPPVHFDACILVADASEGPRDLCGHFGTYRLLLADLVALTMCEESLNHRRLVAVERCLRSTPLRSPRFVRTVFRPTPLGKLTGRRVWLVTTSPRTAGPALSRHAEALGLDVAGTIHSLADREALAEDLKKVGKKDEIMVELKAAAVDVVAAHGARQGIPITYFENRPQPVDGSDLARLFQETAELAVSRFTDR